MSRGDWRTVLTIGLSLLAAFIIGVGLYLDATREERIYEKQAAEKAQYYRDTARIRVQARCAALPRAEITPCVYQEYYAARQGEHDEYDLQAQLVTSVWTRTMGIAAVIGMAVGIFGVGLIYKTFHETRIANEIARTQAAQTRPWLSFANLKVHHLNMIRPEQGKEGDDWLITATIEVEIINSGSTPAKDIRVITHVVDDPIDEETETQVEHWAKHQSETNRGFPMGILPPNGTGIYKNAVPCVVPYYDEHGAERRDVFPGIALAVIYREIGGDTIRQTVQVFRLSNIDPEQHSDTPKATGFWLTHTAYPARAITITAGSKMDRAT